MKLKRIGLASLATIALLPPAASQTESSHALWYLYFAAGTDAVESKDWQAAETLYTSAIRQTDHSPAKEPFFTFAKYSLALVYWEEGRKDEADETLSSIQLKLDTTHTTLDLHRSVDLLTSLGNSLFAEAQQDEKDAGKSTDGLARTRLQQDSDKKYLFARRYYEWAAAVDSRFYAPDSPELDNVVANLAVASYRSHQYAGATESLQQLKKIMQASTQRATALSNGSAAYSLASSSAPKANAKGGAALLVSVQTVDSLMAVNYEDEALALDSDRQVEASALMTKAETTLLPYVRDPQKEHNVQNGMARIYREHARILRRLKKNQEADKLEGLARKIDPATA